MKILNWIRKQFGYDETIDLMFKKMSDNRIEFQLNHIYYGGKERWSIGTNLKRSNSSDTLKEELEIVIKKHNL